MSENSKIVKEIQDYCFKYDISADAFAKKAGTSQPTISRLLSGKQKNPTLNTIFKIKQVLKSREFPKSSLSASKIKPNGERKVQRKTKENFLKVLSDEVYTTSRDVKDELDHKYPSLSLFIEALTKNKLEIALTCLKELEKELREASK